MSCGVFKAKGGLESQCDPEKYTHVTTGTDKVENVGEGNEKLMKLDLNFFGESLGLAPRGRRLVAIEAVLMDGGMDSDSSLAHVEAIRTRGKEKKEEEERARIKPSASVHFQACGCFTDPGRIWSGAEEQKRIKLSSG
ncbi:hypothetical protein KOW79_000178 [Hemibagrus wyckioides]|uniref:Uncharacterized protein n=1 Tax=Hemibagrus wyckioides TaxID=337641 RepID=A0A9D3P667_9TELE|nr:hypothetical protein KOW79_000178 [Hemibagrus wyckioides]